MLLDILDDPALAAHRPGQTLIADKNYYGREFETSLARSGIDLLRPARKGEPERPRRPLLQTPTRDHRVDQRHLQGQLDLEPHGAHTPAGVIVRVWQRVPALTAAIWHNDKIGAPVKRSLTAYDH